MKLYRIAINFIDHYRSLFLNPAENAAEIIITTALVLIGALVIWLFAGLLINMVRNRWRRLRYDKNLPLVWALYLGALAIFGVLVGTVALPVTSNSAFCGRACHSMNPQFQSWRRSAHAKVPCYSCHVDDSFPDLLKEKFIVGTGELIHEVTGNYKKPVNSSSAYSQKSVPVERCLRCHSPRTRFFSVRLGLSMNHPAHLNAGLRCTTCHNRVAHPKSETYSPLREKNKGFKYKDFMTMRQGCWRCHKTGGRFVDAGGVGHKGPFLAKKGQKAPTDCRVCHSTLWKELPKFHHPARGVKWGRGLAHGEVARDNFKACQGCHEPTVWCSTRCHFGITMPHVKGWVNAHPAFAKKDIKRCFACHKVIESLDFCGKRCHHDKFQKQFNLDKNFAWSSGKEQHGVAVRATGGQPCFKCHEQNTWCTTQCHKGITMPHVAGWRNIHFKYVKYENGHGWLARDAVCKMCHNKDGSDDNYCFSCHHKSYRRAGPIGLMQDIKRTGVGADLKTNGQRLSCEDCHIHKDLVFCRDCHTGKTPRDSVKGG